MSKFYIKNKEGRFIPIELKSILNKDLNNKLAIVRVGNDEIPPTMEDIEITEESFRQAEVLDSINLSIILTPFHIDVGLVNKEELENKELYIQIIGGDDIGQLEDAVKNLYKNIKRKFSTTVLPTPLMVKDYLRVKDILRRCKIRKERRGRSKG